VRFSARGVQNSKTPQFFLGGSPYYILPGYARNKNFLQTTKKLRGGGAPHSFFFCCGKYTSLSSFCYLQRLLQYIAACGSSFRSVPSLLLLPQPIHFARRIERDAPGLVAELQPSESVSPTSLGTMIGTTSSSLLACSRQGLTTS
jgi:hypothetical protein